jgi:hypothetical protein
LVIQPKERKERRDHLGDKDKEGMIILNSILKKLGECVDWIHLSEVKDW